MDSVGHLVRLEQGADLSPPAEQHVPSGRPKAAGPRGSHQLFDPEGPKVQPGHGDVPPMARLQVGVRPELFQPARRGSVCEGYDACTRGTNWLTGDDFDYFN